MIDIFYEIYSSGVDSLIRNDNCICVHGLGSRRHFLPAKSNQLHNNKGSFTTNQNVTVKYKCKL